MIRVQNFCKFIGLRASLLSSVLCLSVNAKVLEVGVERQYKTVCEAVSDAEAGDVIVLASETISGACSWKTPGLTIRGEGNSIVQLQPNQTAWQIAADETVIENVAFSGEAAGDQASTAVQQIGGRLTLRHVRIQRAGIGVRSVEAEGSALTIEQSQISENARNIVVEQIGEFNLIGSVVRDAKGGDSIETSAASNNIVNNKLGSLSPLRAARELVVKDSSTSNIAGNLFERGESNDSGVFVQYVSSMDAAGSLTVAGNTFFSETAGVLFVEPVGTALPSASVERNVFLGGLVAEALGSDLPSGNFFGLPEFTVLGQAKLAPEGTPADWGAPAALLGDTVVEEGREQGSMKKMELAAAAPAVGSYTLPVSSLVGGAFTKATVSLAAAAPSGGTYITLKSSHPTIAYSSVSTVWIPGGSRTATVMVYTKTPGATTTVTLTASVSGSSKSDTLVVTPVVLKSVVLEKTQVGSNATLTNNRVYLSGPAPSSGVTVSLTESNSYATVPTSVFIPVGAVSAVFKLTSKAVSSPQPVTITAKTSTGTASDSITVVPVAVEKLESLPGSVVGGSVLIVKAHLNGPAPSGGLKVLLSSSEAGTIPLPASITAAAGATYVSVASYTEPVGSTHSVTLTANTNGIRQSDAVTVSPAALYGLVSSSSVPAGTRLTINAKTDGPAPAGGLVVSLKSSNSTVLSVPASVTIPAGGTSASFVATAGKPASDTTATISATAKGVTKTKVVTVDR